MGIHDRHPVFFVVAAAATFFAMMSFAEPVMAGTIHNVDGWAWSGNTGWISVNCEDPKPGFPAGDCASANGDYGLDIDVNGNLAGWAWSEKSGWICFGVSCDGAPGVPVAGTPSDDHFCPSNVPCAIYDPNDGQFHGWAYIIGATSYSGWMSLNCTDVSPNTASPHACGSEYAVEFDEGVSGSDANFSGFSWSGIPNGTGDGWVQWACAAARPCGGVDWGVTSSWVLSGWVAVVQQEGIYHPDLGGAQTELTDIPIVFTEFSAPENATLRCFFQTSDNSYKEITWTITERLSKESVWSPGSYTVLETDPLVNSEGDPVLWSFAAPWPAVFGCEIQASPPAKKSIDNTIAVHPLNWEFTGAGGSLGSDSNRAKFCLDGNLGAIDASRGYFLNSVQCDTEGDLAMTLLKAKGVNIEVKCSDNIDDDGNFQKDCDGGTLPTLDPDRNCRGITYMCITHPPAPTSNPPLP